MEGLRQDAQGAQVVSSTRFPGWRIFGFLLAFNNTIWAAFSVSRILSPHDPSTMTTGWVTGSTPAGSPAFHTFILCMGLTIAGAAVSVKRPAWGFLMLGAGFLAGAMSIAVLYGHPTNAGGCLFLGGAGALYTWLGVRQKAADRG